MSTDRSVKRVALSTRVTLLFAGFAIQSAEQVLFLPGWLMAQRPDFGWPGQAQYAVAATLLTLAAAAIVILSGQWRFAGIWAWALAGLAGAMLLNAISDVLMSLATLSVMPGAVSGVLLMAPLAAWVLAGLVAERLLSARAAAIAAVIGTALTPVASGAALRGAAWLLT